MKKRIWGFLLISFVACPVAGCSSNTGDTNLKSAIVTEQSEQVNESVSKVATEAIPENVSETEEVPADTQSSLENDTQETINPDEENETNVNETETTETGEEITVFEVMDSIYSVAPGTAGSSLKLAYASGMFIDYVQTNGEKADEIKDFVTDEVVRWMKNNGGEDEAFQDDFMECWNMVKDKSLSMIQNLEVARTELEDSGYTLEYDEYSMEYFDKVCKCIDEAISTNE